MNYESLRKYKVGIYIKFCHMLRGKIFEKNKEIRIGGQICPLPVCLGLKATCLLCSFRLRQNESVIAESSSHICEEGMIRSLLVVTKE